MCSSVLCLALLMSFTPTPGSKQLSSGMTSRNNTSYLHVSVSGQEEGQADHDKYP
jgi:hypothetical protein